MSLSRRGPHGPYHLPLAALCGLLLTLGGGPTGLTPAAAQTDEPVPVNTRGRLNKAAFWRAVREGRGGLIVAPAARRHATATPHKGCAANDSCSERAVGFSLPVHDRVPAVREPRGRGTSLPALLLLVLVLGGGLIGGTVLVSRLGGRNPPNGPSQELPS
jgi:hypothetical protein